MWNFPLMSGCYKKLMNQLCFACRYDLKRWPHHLDRPPNLRLVDWLPLNDLLGRNNLPHLSLNYLLQT